MNNKEGLARSVGVRSAVLLCCSALVSGAAAIDNTDARLSLQVDGGFLSVDIRDKPLAEVARAFEGKTGATFHFHASEVKDLAITVQFEKLALDAALRAILKETSYAMDTGPTKQGIGIQVYVYSTLPEDASNPGPAAGEIDASGQALDPGPQLAATRPKNPTEIPVPPEVFDPDPAARVMELEGAVTSYGPQSLGLVLAAAHDPDALVRSASEELLLNDLRDVVPRETLATIASTSERTDIRLQALEALSGRQDQLDYARMTLDGALHDTDPDVQQRAEELLVELSESEADSESDNHRNENLR